MFKIQELREDPLYFMYAYFYKKYGEPIGIGRNRIAWKTKGGNVVKVPRCEFGIIDNNYESSVYSDDIYPRTRAFRFADVCICVMEYLEPATEDYKELPSWAGSIDCAQVGRNKSGELKAYDYGLM